jgi:ectoine hydroxylase-related dioxygenase (phytanoyl-CoA dioxygenase family)
VGARRFGVERLAWDSSSVGADEPPTAETSPTASDVDARRRMFADEGFLVFDSGIPQSTIDAAIKETESQFRAEGPVKRAMRRAGLRGYRLLRARQRIVSYRDTVRVQDAWTTSENVRAIARAPRVLELLRELYGREPLPFQTLSFKRGSEQSPHSDAWHFNSQPPGFMCGVWVALEDIHEDSGPLIYYPGSHKLGEVTRAEVSEARMPADQAYPCHVQSLIKRERLQPRYGTLPKAKALLWSSNLLHGGAPQRNPAHTRWTQVTHYFFEGCRYWRPLLSEDNGRHYWEPTWVR